MKVFQIVENLNKGSVENWLVAMFLVARKSNPEIEWTFFCIEGQSGQLDEVVLANGGNIIYSPYKLSQKVGFLIYLRKCLKKKEYDVVHAQHDFLSGFYLLARLFIPFKKVIINIHNTDEIIPVGNKKIQKILLPIFRQLCFWNSDFLVGVSYDALIFFLNGKKRNEKKHLIQHCGINIKELRTEEFKSKLRDVLKIPIDKKVLLFAGRISYLKNPVFALESFLELLSIRNDVILIFAGSGELDNSLKASIEQLGIVDKVRFLGWRSDVHDLMQISDLFLFPRIEYPKEALGLVLVEAQSVGLPIIMSLAAVKDAILVKDICHQMPLALGAMAWAKRINEILCQTNRPTAEECKFIVTASGFNIHNSTANYIDFLYH